MKRAWIQEVDDEHVALVQSTSGEHLDRLATYCHEAGENHKPGGDWKHAASVDGTVIVDWCHKRGITFSQFMRDQSLITKFLNDPQNAIFRVWKGRL